MNDQNKPQAPSEPVENQGVDESQTPEPVEEQSAESTTEPTPDGSSIEGQIVESIEFEAPSWANDENQPQEPEAPTAESQGISSGDAAGFVLPSEDLQRRIQLDLKDLGRYEGRVNGRWGFATIFAIGKFVGAATRTPNPEFVAGVAHIAGSNEQVLTEEIWESFAEELEKLR